ncbi:MAG: metalloregulator ArsR/SmtB family transcription factor [Phycisphaerae bacterium]
MEAAHAILKAVADESRLRILLVLQDRPLCLAQITEILGLAASTVSRHLQVLVAAGLVTTWPRGRWHYFAINQAEDNPAASEAVGWVQRHARIEGRVREDMLRRALVLKKNDRGSTDRSRLRVLIVSDQCACRVRMAQSFLEDRAPSMLEVTAAGCEQESVDPIAVAVLEEIGLSLPDSRIRPLADLAVMSSFDYVIVLEPAESLDDLPLPLREDHQVWSVCRPETTGRLEQRLRSYRQARDEIAAKVDGWLQQHRIRATLVRSIRKPKAQDRNARRSRAATS